MKFPIVYDLLLRMEIRAKDKQAALDSLAKQVGKSGFDMAGLEAAFELIRNDNDGEDRDVASQQGRGFAIFTAAQKRNLVNSITEALQECAKGNAAPGQKLLENLAHELDYMDNPLLAGVKL